MAQFEAVADWVLAHEGGFSNHPQDPGGATNFGISLRYLESKGLPEGDVDGDGEIGLSDIQKMTKEKAKEFLREDFWDPLRLSEFKSDSLAGKVLDLAFNMGPKPAVQILQRAVNQFLGKPGIKVDGVIGDVTLFEVEQIPWQYLRTTVCVFAWMRYRSLIEKNPSLEVFSRGWENRAFA